MIFCATVRSWLISLLLLTSSLVKADVTDSLPGKYVQFDHVGNVYELTREGVTKYSPDSLLKDRFHPRGYGKLSSLDVSNPLKVVLFYQELSKVVLLDKNLSEITTIDLAMTGLDQVVACANASQGGVWIFDLANFELSRIDQSGVQHQQSGNLSGIVSMELDVSSIVEYKNRVYVVSQGNGILVFDQLGNFIKAVNQEGIVAAVPAGDYIYFISDGQIAEWDADSWEVQQYNSVGPNATAIYTSSQGFVVHSSFGTRIYSIGP